MIVDCFQIGVSYIVTGVILIMVMFNIDRTLWTLNANVLRTDNSSGLLCRH